MFHLTADIDHIVFEKLFSTSLLKIIKTETIKICGNELARHNIYDQSLTQVRLDSHYSVAGNCTILSNSSFIYLALYLVKYCIIIVN